MAVHDRVSSNERVYRSHVLLGRREMNFLTLLNSSSSLSAGHQSPCPECSDSGLPQLAQIGSSITGHLHFTQPGLLPGRFGDKSSTHQPMYESRDWGKRGQCEPNLAEWSQCPHNWRCGSVMLSCRSKAPERRCEAAGRSSYNPS